ncbi:hypothetical protein NMY22_g17462 [Coprinellus aureogranulatus]|nr:hypothetical protein NMY22_g17462 [Coprinellus aureogranulatus]
MCTLMVCTPPPPRYQARNPSTTFSIMSPRAHRHARPPARCFSPETWTSTPCLSMGLTALNALSSQKVPRSPIGRIYDDTVVLGSVQAAMDSGGSKDSPLPGTLYLDANSLGRTTPSSHLPYPSFIFPSSPQRFERNVDDGSPINHIEYDLQCPAQGSFLCSQGGCNSPSRTELLTQTSRMRRIRQVEGTTADCGPVRDRRKGMESLVAKSDKPSISYIPPLRFCFDVAGEYSEAPAH